MGSRCRIKAIVFRRWIMDRRLSLSTLLLSMFLSYPAGAVSPLAFDRAKVNQAPSFDEIVRGRTKLVGSACMPADLPGAAKLIRKQFDPRCLSSEKCLL